MALRIIVFLPIKMTALSLMDARICCICLELTLSAPTIKHFGYSSRSACNDLQVATQDRVK